MPDQRLSRYVPRAAEPTAGAIGRRPAHRLRAQALVREPRARRLRGVVADDRPRVRPAAARAVAGRRWHHRVLLPVPRPVVRLGSVVGPGRRLGSGVPGLPAFRGAGFPGAAGFPAAGLPVAGFRLPVSRRLVTRPLESRRSVTRLPVSRGRRLPGRWSPGGRSPGRWDPGGWISGCRFPGGWISGCRFPALSGRAVGLGLRSCGRAPSASVAGRSAGGFRRGAGCRPQVASGALARAGRRGGWSAWSRFDRSADGGGVRRASRPRPEVMPKSNAIYVVRVAFDGRANLV